MMHEHIEGFELAQNNWIDVPFKLLAQELANDELTIIELGTAKGGFAIFLAQIFNRQIITFDIESYGENIKTRHKVFKKNRVIFYNESFYNGRAVDIINKSSKCLLLVDGGNKIDEFKYFAQFLRTGDIIMAHDYAPDGNYFNDNIFRKYWGFFELGDGHVDEVCKKYNIVPHKLQPEFIPAVWKICIKQ